ncbi:MAG: hypothetical protein HY899_11615 [Deltaproteobacteria bacterium]|nr:hypothetical protein [Deltaproteobacteria bacterium]
MLARSLRAVCGVALVLIAASAGAHIAWSGPRYPSIFLLELTQVVIVLAALRWLQRRQAKNRLLAVAVAVFAVFYMTSAALGTLAGNAVTSALIFSAFALATGAMLPWGLQPQLITVSVAGLALLAQVFFFDAYNLAGGYQAASLGVTAVALLASLGMVWRIESYRLQSSKDHSLWLEAERALTDVQTEIERRVGERIGELESANRDLESFSYSVSHDLRAPLRTVSGFTEVLIEDYGGQLDPKAIELVQRLRAAIQRMGDLVDALLEVSRVTHHELRAETVDLAAVAGEIVGDLAVASPQRSVEVTVAPGLVAHGDSRLLRVLLTNLIENAWKFTSRQASPRIEIGQREDGGETTYFVRDNGVGFDEKTATGMFTAFSRFHPGFEGTGIGLSIAARVVARHGGRIWAEGRPGEGATFLFTLRG